MEVILVYIAYENDLIRQEMKISSITEIKEYSNIGVVLGDWKTTKEFQFEPHLKMKIGNCNRNLDIAIRMTAEEKEKIDFIQFGQTSAQICCDLKNNYYFVPMVHWNKKWNGELERESQATYYTTIGMMEIKVAYKNGEEEKRVLVSITDKENYQKLLDDLIEVQIELVMDKYSGIGIDIQNKEGTSNKPENKELKSVERVFKELKNKIEQLEQVIHRIEKRPEHDLIQTYGKVSAQKIKHITNRTIVEKMVYQKPRVNAIVYEESNNIYEHRMLLFYLTRMQKLISKMEKMEDNILKRQIKEIATLLKDDYDYHIVSSNEEVSSNKEKNKIAKAKKGKVEEKKELENKKKKDWIQLSNKIETLLKSKIFQGLKVQKESLHKTNLFVDHSDYKLAYRIMSERKELVQTVEFDTTPKFPIAKLWKLYEYWCCIKLLSLFIRTYSFTFELAVSKEQNNKSWTNLQQYIGEVLHSGTFYGTEFVLKSQDLGMEVTLFFNCEFSIKNIQKQYLPFKSNGKSSLHPDIVLKIKYKNNEEKLFCMDAKYRSDSERSSLEKKSEINAGMYDWYTDICEVALQKYFIELGNGYKEITGSFILHSNVNLENAKILDEFKFDPKGYYGAKAEKIVDEYERIHRATGRIKKLNETFTKEAQNWAKERMDSNENENRIGSIAVFPNNDTYLKNLIRMIMEQHFDLNLGQCWICGNRNIGKKELVVAEPIPITNGVKQYVTCTKCGEFWVITYCYHCYAKNKHKRTLIKHSLNYHEDLSFNDKNSWNVVCPWCSGHL